MPKSLRIVRDQGGGTSASQIEAMDQAVVGILGDLGKEAIDRTSLSTESIFKLSTQYVTKPAFDALSGFYQLYFSKQDTLDQQKLDVNAEVDALFEAAVAAMEKGDMNLIQEDQKQKEERLALAALQKRLEGLIVLDQGIKDEILPAIASMQFEDGVRQRLAHLNSMWTKAFALLLTTPGEISAREAALEMAGLTTSVDETKTFYNMVLGEEAPAHVDQGGEAGLLVLF
jgi:hypothetical protein